MKVELKQNLIKAGLGDSEAAIVLRALSDLDIVTVTDANGKVDVEDISKNIAKGLTRIDERHRNIAISEIVRFIHDIIPKVYSETQSKIDKVYDDLIRSFNGVGRPCMDTLRLICLSSIKWLRR